MPRRNAREDPLYYGKIDIEVGRRVKSYRKALGYTQQDLGYILGMSPIALHYIEIGRNSMSVTQLYRICSFFNCQSFELMPDIKPFIIKYIKPKRR